MDWRISHIGLILIMLFGMVAAAGAVDPPEIEWQKCLGGTGEDEARSIALIPDGGYIIAGWSGSNDGDVTGNYGQDDFWIVKLDSMGGIDWQKCLGGTGSDTSYSIAPTPDGGFIIAGDSHSNDGDATGNHGLSDIWVVKLDSMGAITWEKCLGGTWFDNAWTISVTPDGGYIIAGDTSSTDGDVSGNHGGGDAWIVKLDSMGALTWQKCLGGTDIESARSIALTPDGGYIVTGGSRSNDGDVTGNHGQGDVWVVKLDSVGAIIWEKCLGGIWNENALDIALTPDGGYIIGGITYSIDGDISGNHGGGDAWIVKLDSMGAITWEKCLGGTGYDSAMSVTPTTDGGYIVAGECSLNNGDVSGNHGESDYWVVKLDSMGAIAWEKCLGGSSSEDAHDIQQTSDGGYIVVGQSSSNDGDVLGNHGVNDVWLVKLTGSGPQLPQLTPFPSCTNLPTDPDGDGIYEDTNGNGRKDFNDIVIFFKQMTWVSQNEPIECFDFNANGRIDFNDVVMMFQEM